MFEVNRPTVARRAHPFMDDKPTYISVLRARTLLGADSADPRVVWASAHLRHGFLLAPGTADLIDGELSGKTQEHAFSPAPFASGMSA